MCACHRLRSPARRRARARRAHAMRGPGDGGAVVPPDDRRGAPGPAPRRSAALRDLGAWAGRRGLRRSHPRGAREGRTGRQLVPAGRRQGHVGPPMSRRPLIGISTSEERPTARSDPAPQGEPPRREMVLGMSYVRAIDAAGGLPIVLPPVHHAGADELLDDLDGLCLPGGPDIHPTLYGAEPHPRLGPTWPQLDSFELALARRADRTGLPILAVCRGAQILNVARGGSL